MRPIQPPYCPRCCLPVTSGEAHLCSRCLRERLSFEAHRSYGIYEGTLKEAIHRFKYQGERQLVKVFGDLLYPLFQTAFHDHPVDLIAPVPLHIKRLRERGFNQSLLLARALSKRTGIPYYGRLLKKIKHTPVQTELRGRERRKNVKGAFRAEDIEIIGGKTIVLVDDVYTTGATINECARTLLKAGAARVSAITLARAL